MRRAFEPIFQSPDSMLRLALFVLRERIQRSLWAMSIRHTCVCVSIDTVSLSFDGAFLRMF